MKNLINKLFRKEVKKEKRKYVRKTLTDEQKTIVLLSDGQRALEAHVIALARLLFVKPSNFYREASNHKANTDYIKLMLEEKKEK